MTVEKMLVRGKIWNPLNATQWTYYPEGAMVINPEGRIESIGDYATLKTYPGITQVLDFSDQLILPGLIDTHIHLPQLPIRGITGNSLLDWLNKLAFPAEIAFEEHAYAKTLSGQFFESLKANGTTTALVLSSVHEESTHNGFEAAEASGMRVLMGKVMMDQNAPEALLETLQQSVTASTRLAQTWHGKADGLLGYAFTPRFALSCSQAMLEAAAGMQQEFPGSYLHSHLSENLEEIDAVTSLYDKQYSYTRIYEKTGCLGPRTIMAHGIYLTPEELDILQETQTRIAHCPTSNFFLKSGVFNLAAFEARRIPFALGSDVGGGPDLCMFRVMRAMDDMQLSSQRFIKPIECLYYATLAGAKVLSLEEETGNLQSGKSADFIVVDLQTLETAFPEEPTIEAILSRLVYLGDDRLIRKTFVRGREVYSSTTAIAERLLVYS